MRGQEETLGPSFFVRSVMRGRWVREQRRKDAKDRQKARNKLKPEEQIATLLLRPGESSREIERLRKQ